MYFLQEKKTLEYVYTDKIISFFEVIVLFVG